MAVNLFKKCKPDSYVHSVYDIRYNKLRENGFKYMVFDVDCTILPFDDVNVTEDNKLLFRYINNLGIKSALCSSSFEGRIKPVASELEVNYVALAPKPFIDFSTIYNLFDHECTRDNTIYIGDSIYFDMLLAGRLGIHKILVDMINTGNSFKIYPNEVMNAAIFQNMRKYGLEEKHYYRGFIER